jgi:hypothetical protein
MPVTGRESEPRQAAARGRDGNFLPDATRKFRPTGAIVLSQDLYKEARSRRFSLAQEL